MEDQVSKGTYVDGMLVDWGTALFNQTPVAAVKPKRGLTGFVVPKKPKASGGAVGEGAAPSAKVIRSKLGSIAKRAPEVMVKITVGREDPATGKPMPTMTDMRSIKAHFDYISRNGQIELEDEDGNTVTGRDGLNALRDEWRNGGFQIPEEGGTKREAFNIILSMPEGTDPLAVKRAVRDFAASEFADHQYVMALHTFDTDPDPKPSPHPHVHLSVKATSLDGVRLNPRKVDLQRWREGFAEALREHGVEAAATKREQRTLRTKSRKETRFKNTEKQLGKKGRAATKVNRSPADPSRVAKARNTEAQVLKSYHEITKALASSEDVEDRKLAVSLVHRLNEQRVRPSPQAERDNGHDR